MSDQKHENAGEPRLRPVETMKANTGNGKLPGTKERKSGHCELQRTAWKSTVDIQFGQTRGTNKKGKRKEKTKKKERRGRERGEEKSKWERETDRMRGRERIRNRAELSRPRRLREARVRRSLVRSLARFPILPKTTDFGTDIDSRRRYRHTPAFSGCPTRVRNERGWESIAARNNLQPFRA